jgi:hypothetical protein
MVESGNTIVGPQAAEQHHDVEGGRKLTVA